MDNDGDGCLTFDEFRRALTDMPRSVLLQDFRQRLLARHPCLAAAFKELASVPAHSRGACSKIAEEERRFTQPEFVRQLVRLGVAEVEASELFRLIDDDASGDVSMAELREAVRSVAPTVSLESFWRRVVADLPGLPA